MIFTNQIPFRPQELGGGWQRGNLRALYSRQGIKDVQYEEITDTNQ